MNSLLKRLSNIAKGESSGFSLLELVVVVSVMAVILAIAMPPMINWLRGRGVRDAALQLSMDLQRAKLLAIQRGANCSITINAPAINQYTISITNEVVDLGNYQGAVVFSNAPNPSAPVITFTPQGVCQISGAFFLTDQNLRYRVRTSVAGAVSLHLFSNGQWT